MLVTIELDDNEYKACTESATSERRTVENEIEYLLVAQLEQIGFKRKGKTRRVVSQFEKVAEFIKEIESERSNLLKELEEEKVKIAELRRSISNESSNLYQLHNAIESDLRMAEANSIVLRAKQAANGGVPESEEAA